MKPVLLQFTYKNYDYDDNSHTFTVRESTSTPYHNRNVFIKITDTVRYGARLSVSEAKLVRDALTEFIGDDQSYVKMYNAWKEFLSTQIAPIDHTDDSLARLTFLMHQENEEHNGGCDHELYKKPHFRCERQAIRLWDDGVRCTFTPVPDLSPTSPDLDTLWEQAIPSIANTSPAESPSLIVQGLGRALEFDRMEKYTNKVLEEILGVTGHIRLWRDSLLSCMNVIPSISESVLTVISPEYSPTWHSQSVNVRQLLYGNQDYVGPLLLLRLSLISMPSGKNKSPVSFISMLLNPPQITLRKPLSLSVGL